MYIKEKPQKLSCRKFSAYLDFMTRNLHRRIISACENQEFLSALRTAFDHLLLGPFVFRVILSENRDVNLPLAAWFRDHKWNKMLWHPNKWMEARLFKLCVPIMPAPTSPVYWAEFCLSCFSPLIIHVVLKNFWFYSWDKHAFLMLCLPWAETFNRLKEREVSEFHMRG